MLSVVSVLASGLFGAVLAQVLSIVWKEYSHRREYRSLMLGVERLKPRIVQTRLLCMVKQSKIYKW